MLPLPWWILGVGPEEGIGDDSDNETTDEPTAEECSHEIATTPISIFRTPSASPFIEVPDQLPKVVEFSTFLNVAKRRSSSRLESVTPKVRKTEKRSSLVRSETEVMNKSADGQSILDFDETFGVPFNTQPAENGSPMPFTDAFNKTFHSNDDIHAVTQIEDKSSEESPKVREYPLFFTSFDDTTVLFNTTIAGDLDIGQKNDAVGDWVFKNSEFLKDANPADQTVDLSDAGDSADTDAVFKSPTQNTKKMRGRPRASAVPRTSSRRAASVKKNKTPEKKATPEEKEEEANEETEQAKQAPDTPRTAPSLTRRHTPSRKAKTYKSLRE